MAASAIARAGDSVNVLNPPGITLQFIVTAVAAAGLAGAAASAAAAAATAAQACAGADPGAVAAAADATSAASEASSAASSANAAALAALPTSPGAAAAQTSNAAAAAARCATSTAAAGAAAAGVAPALAAAAAAAAATTTLASVAAAAAGIPQVGFLVVPLAVRGVVKNGSGKFSFTQRGAAHIGDQVLVGLPPVMNVTGTIAGTLTFVPTFPMQGTIETGSEILSFDGRGVARIGDTCQLFFPPMIPFTGVIAGAPLTVPVAVLSPVRGFIAAGFKFRAA